MCNLTITPQQEVTKCPMCEKEGRRSLFRIDKYGSKTLMDSPWVDFYDENGNFHTHDPNWTMRGAACSNGHYMQVKTKDPCAYARCNWNMSTGVLKPHIVGEGTMETFDDWGDPFANLPIANPM